MPTETKPLFRPDALRPHLRQFLVPRKVVDLRPRIIYWSHLLGSPAGLAMKERELLPLFLSEVFQGILGYTSPADGGPRYTISREQHVQVDGKYADAVLGEFTDEGKRFTVAVEGKGPQDPLDRAHAGRKMSAVDQGYRYAINLQCDWIIVTSMRQIRLYYKGSDQHTCEQFDLDRLATDDGEYARFVYLLSAERVAPVAGKCHLYALLAESEQVGKDLTKRFYIQYADMREDVFETLSAANPSVDRKAILSATQKMLDRVLFCAFCEDRGLLPAASIEQAYLHSDPYNPRPTWENFRGLFRAIDQGSERLKIAQYNGGLFAADPLLDALAVPDEVCRHFKVLSDYNYCAPQDLAEASGGYEPIIDVDILGHIFEQSITDVEKLRNELEGREPPAGAEKHKTRRKKEGAFYTPAFITRYIVEQALGNTLADRFEKLRQEHAGSATASTQSVLVDPRIYDVVSLKKPQRIALVGFWEAWQEQLQSIRILDPACGSGAFLIEAFDQLHDAYTAANDRLEEVRGHRTLFDLDRQILQHNLYGVDLNDEAIDICRLSLWIKTAQRGKILTSLDHSIRVGNSVVDDPALAGEKAFNWQQAFPEVFAAGGFDVVVGNPPYIRQEWTSPFKPHWERRFSSYNGGADIFVYFYELGVTLLRGSGRLGFITSGSWMRSSFGSQLRGFLSSASHVESLVDFGEYQPFPDAEMIRPSILVFEKRPPGGDLRVFRWVTTGTPPEDLSEVIRTAPQMDAAHLSSAAWEIDSAESTALKERLFSVGVPLSAYCEGRMFVGIKPGTTDAFIIDQTTRDRLIGENPSCASLIRPFIRGQDIRSWRIDRELWVILLKSSEQHTWPWSNSGSDAERVFGELYPSLYAHLSQSKPQLAGRQDRISFWWELRSCAYWDELDKPKILWPDITNRPRFAMDSSGDLQVGNTGFFISRPDYYLLGVLASWVTWFCISKTAQPLRLRSDRWQYRLFTPYMERIPIPEASAGDRQVIASLARRAGELARQRDDVEQLVRHRFVTAFRPAEDVTAILNTKANEWWTLSLKELGESLKASFKLITNPFRNPATADEWEPYLAAKRDEVERLGTALADAESELNERVYKLFGLTRAEVQLLKREVEH